MPLRFCIISMHSSYSRCNHNKKAEHLACKNDLCLFTRLTPNATMPPQANHNPSMTIIYYFAKYIISGVHGYFMMGSRPYGKSYLQ